MPGRALIDAYIVLRALNLQEGDVVVEFGCGHHGHLLFPAARRVGNTGSVVGIDLRHGALAMLRNRIPHEGVHNVETVWGDIERDGGTGLEDGCADHVVCMNTLSSVRDVPAVLREMLRVAGSTGVMYLIDWHPMSAHPVSPDAQVCHDSRVVADTLRRRGFVVEAFPVSDAHWGLRLRPASAE